MFGIAAVKPNAVSALGEAGYLLFQTLGLLTMSTYKPLQLG